MDRALRAVSNPDPLLGWVPLFIKEDRVEWGYMGGERFVEPFCQQSVQRIARRPFNQLFRRKTGLDLLRKRATTHPGLPLSGLILHMSRCGSTLVAHALAALPDSVVLSEPEALDSLIRHLIAMGELYSEAGLATLNGLVAALGQPRRTADRRLFIKTDCWHIGHLGALLSAFPGTPWLFLYRDPVEVMVSQMLMPGSFVVPGAMLGHGLKPPDRLLNRPPEHGAWVLAQVLLAAEEAYRRLPNGMLMDYSELPEALETRLAGHFKLGLSGVDIGAIRAACTRDVKQPDRMFQPDAAEKHAAASDGVLAMVEQWLAKPYEDLKKLRSGQHIDG